LLCHLVAGRVAFLAEPKKKLEFFYASDKPNQTTLQSAPRFATENRLLPPNVWPGGLESACSGQLKSLSTSYFDLLFMLQLRFGCQLLRLFAQLVQAILEQHGSCLVLHSRNEFTTKVNRFNTAYRLSSCLHFGSQTAFQGDPLLVCRFQSLPDW
jgi:hypothetical protein